MIGWIVLGGIAIYFWREIIGAISILGGGPLPPGSLEDTDKEGQARVNNSTGTDNLVGTTAQIIKNPAADRELRIEAMGTTWRAISLEGETLSPGDSVRIVKVDGLTVIVQKSLQ